MYKHMECRLLELLNCIDVLLFVQVGQYGPYPLLLFARHALFRDIEASSSQMNRSL